MLKEWSAFVGSAEYSECVIEIGFEFEVEKVWFIAGF